MSKATLKVDHLSRMMKIPTLIDCTFYKEKYATTPHNELIYFIKSADNHDQDFHACSHSVVWTRSYAPRQTIGTIETENGGISAT